MMNDECEDRMLSTSYAMGCNEFGRDRTIASFLPTDSRPSYVERRTRTTVSLAPNPSRAVRQCCAAVCRVSTIPLSNGIFHWESRLDPTKQLRRLSPRGRRHRCADSAWELSAADAEQVGSRQNVVRKAGVGTRIGSNRFCGGGRGSRDPDPFPDVGCIHTCGVVGGLPRADPCDVSQSLYVGCGGARRVGGPSPSGVGSTNAQQRTTSLHRRSIRRPPYVRSPHPPPPARFYCFQKIFTRKRPTVGHASFFSYEVVLSVFRVWCVENQSGVCSGATSERSIGGGSRGDIGVASEWSIGVEHRRGIRATLGVDVELADRSFLTVLCFALRIAPRLVLYWSYVEGEAQDGQEGPVLCQLSGQRHRNGTSEGGRSDIGVAPGRNIGGGSE